MKAAGRLGVAGMEQQCSHSGNDPVSRTLATDLLIIGGGINGSGIARDAAGRGLKVLLCEQHDLAAHTSSASTKLIHGGLRYLQQYQFSLVRKALQERAILLRLAPHLVRPQQFVLPYRRDARPAWMIRAGLFLYDHLAARGQMPAAGQIDLTRHISGRALKPGFETGFVYSDAVADDARLVLLNALDAHQRGAEILTGCRCVALAHQQGRWHASLRCADGSLWQVQATALVNAGGPWVQQAAGRLPGLPQDSAQARQLRLVKGSHIVIRHKFAHPYAYLMQHNDGRVVFALPYHEHFTLIGTTESDYAGDPAAVSVSSEEIDYLLTLCNRYFAMPISTAQIVHSYAGVRPLLAQAGDTAASQLSRDYQLQFDPAPAPLLTVYGGKMTTYRRLAEQAMLMLKTVFPALGDDWTSTACLPGGDFPRSPADEFQAADLSGFVLDCQRQYHWLSPSLVGRYVATYGTRIHHLLAGCYQFKDLGRAVLPGLWEQEIAFLRQHEWARSSEDILWRRTKLGLQLSGQDNSALDDYLNSVA